MAMMSENEALHEKADAELCKLAKAGNMDASERLIRRYEAMVRILVRPYYLLGAEKEDLIQEGMIGLFQAIYRFEEGRQASFETFARLCILRSAFTAIQAAATKKHSLLNHYVSLEKTLFDDIACEYVSMSPDATDPLSLLIGKEELREVWNRLNLHLSTFEKLVLEQYLREDNCQVIAGNLGKSLKSIDNAIQRIRRKAAHLFP